MHDAYTRSDERVLWAFVLQSVRSSANATTLPRLLFEPCLEVAQATNRVRQYVEEVKISCYERI